MSTVPAPADRSAVVPPLPGVIRLGLVRAQYELRSYVRERDTIAFVFLYPVVMLAIFATVFGRGGTTVGPISFAQYFLPGMIATGVMLSSFQNLATSVAVERDEGGLKRLRGTPLPAASYFLGKVGQVLVTALAQTALLVGSAALLWDVPLPTDAARWWIFAWVFVLGTATGSVCGVAFSSVPRSGRSASAVVVPIVLVLQFISGVFFQFDQLPTWMQQTASVFPLKWMAQGMRSVFLPDSALTLEPSGSWQHGLTAGVLAAWLVLGLVLGGRRFRWLRRDDG